MSRGVENQPHGRPDVAEIVVHDLRQAGDAVQAAAELAMPIQLRSAPDAAAYAGVGYLHALGEAAGHELLIDCGDDAGLVMAALRTGCRRLVFSGSGETFGRLAEMAAEVGATLRHQTGSAAALELSPDDDARKRCLSWLALRADSS